MGLLGTLAVAITGRLEGFEKAMKEMEKKLGGVANNLERTGQDLARMGSGLTKYITVPILGATTAAVGFVAAMGWKRLVSLDEAKAQLIGLGYSMEEVEQVSKLVSESVRGTMLTLPEGISIAAGAMAAGVKEADELQRYIKLVGDAAVAMNKSADETAVIFNRVQGAGKLMGNELRMIEHAMPGFSEALSEHLNIPREELAGLVSQGKVSSAEFLDVMEDFAGGMSKAYAETLPGIIANIKANLGIIGEIFLTGAFARAKEVLGEFLDLLREGDWQEWAEGVGDKITTAFERIIEAVKTAIEWWRELDEEKQKLIATLGIVLVAAGPIITLLSKIALLAKGVVAGIAAIGGSAAMGPILLVIGVLSGLAAVIYNLWTDNEKFRDGVVGAWEAIKALLVPVIESLKENFEKFKESMGPALESLQNALQGLMPWLQGLGVVLVGVVVAAISVFVGALNMAMQVIAPLIQAISGLVAVIANMATAVVKLLSGDFAGAWEHVQAAAQGAIDFFEGMFGIVVGIFKNLVENIISFFKGLYDALVGHSIIPDLVNGIIEWIGSLPGKVLELIGQLVDGVKQKFEDMKTKALEIWDNFKTSVTDKAGEIYTNAKGKLEELWTYIKGLPSQAYNWGKDILSKFWEGLKSIFRPIKAWFDNNVKPLLDALNPWAKHSPSLIDNIRSGVAEIEKIYTGLSLPDYTVQVSPLAAMAGGGGMQHITINANYNVASKQAAEHANDDLIRKLQLRGRGRL